MGSVNTVEITGIEEPTFSLSRQKPTASTTYLFERTSSAMSEIVFR